MTKAASAATPLNELAFELKLAIGRDVAFNQEFESFIARLRDQTQTSALKVSLEYCRASTRKLSELYALLAALAPYEQALRALADSNDGIPKGAMMPPQPKETCDVVRQD